MSLLYDFNAYKVSMFLYSSADISHLSVLSCILVILMLIENNWNNSTFLKKIVTS